MDTLAYENATPNDLGPLPMRGDVWILGCKYHLPEEHSEMMRDIQSRLWFTYRKNFKPIGGTNITCDQGWGCTLRCGQMVMGNTLLHNHLGRDWRWPANAKDERTYMMILNKFLDKKDSDYSLHMIAHQGADFGRTIGQWFGPNNVAQALKKLSVHDYWTQLAVHVALDMVVVVEDMKALCRAPHRKPREVTVESDKMDTIHHTLVYPGTSSANSDSPAHLHVPRRKEQSRTSPNLRKRVRKGKMANTTGGSRAAIGSRTVVNCEEETDEMTEVELREMTEVARNELCDKLPQPAVASTHSPHRSRTDKLRKQLRMPRLTRKKVELLQSADFDRVGHHDCQSDYWQREEEEEEEEDDLSDEMASEEGEKEREKEKEEEEEEGERGANGPSDANEHHFRPLLLFIPLRLGQERFNLEYKQALKACFTLPQSVGVIGGKPRHALYFIGFLGDHLLYLDPHTTQQVVSCSGAGMVPDQSYHSNQADHMSISDLDPSVALAFFCRDEADLNDLCHRLRESVLSKMQYLFELTNKRPQYWGPIERDSVMSVHEPFFLVDQAPPSPKFTSEEDSDGFEVINFA